MMEEIKREEMTKEDKTGMPKHTGLENEGTSKPKASDEFPPS